MNRVIIKNNLEKKIEIPEGKKTGFIWIFGERKNLAGRIEIILAKGAELTNIILFSAVRNFTLDLNFCVTHAGDDSFSNTSIYGVGRDKSSVSALCSARVLKNTKHANVWIEGRALLFGDSSCRIDPRLEVETNEVERAGHAATVSRISDEDLFYMATRGVDPNSAERLKSEGFLATPLLRAELGPEKAKEIISPLLI